MSESQDLLLADAGGYTLTSYRKATQPYINLNPACHPWPCEPCR